MQLPMSLEEIERAQLELVSRNQLQEGLLYLQVTRGAADREFAFPAGTSPTLVMFTQTKALVDSALAARGARVCLVEDDRWGRCHIKTVQLLSASLAHQASLNAGFDDAWFTRDGYVTEATSANAYIVTADGRIITRALGNDILPGITREAVLEIVAKEQLQLEERPFSIEEAKRAAEAFMSSATKFVTGVVAIEDCALSDGAPGPITTQIREAYLNCLPK